MKRFALMLCCCLLLAALPALSEGEAPEPAIPEGDFSVLPVRLTPGKKWPVYAGPIYPGPKDMYPRRAGAGKASLSTNGWVQVLGGKDGAYLFVQYAVGADRLRTGWISADALAKADWRREYGWALGNRFCWRESHLTRDTALTDDPLLSGAEAARLKAGARVDYLARMGGFAYVAAEDEQGPLWGFVPLDAVMHDPVSVDGHPAFRWAADMLQKAGIEAEPSGINEEEHAIYFDLKAGGRFRSYYYGTEYNALLTPLEFNCFFSDASDGDIAKYFDVAFSMLAEVENGSIDHAANWADVENARKVIVSNALLFHDYLREQGLRVLLSQLAAHDGQDALNSLRARMASRLLGVRDQTGVDPKLGCAWYDALRLAEQNALPPVDASLYAKDELLLWATRLMIERESEIYRGYPSSPETDISKCATIVALEVCRREEEGDTATLWASMGCQLIAVYDSKDYRLVSGHWYPVRLKLRKEDGMWRIEELTEPEDGECYWPSIVSMCGGDERLAEKLIQTENGIREATRLYLQAVGCPDAAAGME